MKKICIPCPFCGRCKGPDIDIIGGSHKIINGIIVPEELQFICECGKEFQIMIEYVQEDGLQKLVELSEEAGLYEDEND